MPKLFSLAVLFLIFSSCSYKVLMTSPLPGDSRSHHEARGNKVMAATQGPRTTEAALSLFKEGGNIIDAFVAASFAISVERPHSTGIGGGGFLLYFSARENKVYAFDFREVAPLKAYSEMYLSRSGQPRPELSQDGALAVATPGLVRGLYDIHQRFGKLSWDKTIAPAIKLAREGFPLYPELREALEDRREILLLDPSAKKIFYTPLGTTPPLETPIIQEDLAKTLEIISKQGAKGFYEGEVSRAMVSTVKKRRGLLSHEDLKTYQMVERTPVEGSYRGLKIFSMPPPSSGGVHVIQILDMLAPHDLKKKGPQTTASVHLLAQAMQRAFLDRAKYLGDPDFHPIPVEKLLDKNYLHKLSQELHRPRAIQSTELEASTFSFPYESPETTHFTLSDEEGNMVASTQTINGWFGSGVIAEGTGIILNNEMDDFAQKVGAQNLFGAVGGEKNLIAPKKRPLSSMSPTIITKDNKAYLALGSPSGTRIITCVAQTILNVVEFGMPLYESVAATRVHHQWKPDLLKIEAPYLNPKVEEELRAKGYEVVHDRLGCRIQAIQKIRGGWLGVSDPRGAGLSKGM